MVKIHLLGTAGGLPTKTRNVTSVAIEMNEDIYLLDAGEPCSATLVRKEINHNQIKAIFISHMHADHFGGVGLLIQLMQLTGRRKKLKLFVPQPAVKGVKEYFKTIYLMDELIPFKLDILPIDDGFEYQDEQITLFAYPNKHTGVIKGKYPLVRLKSYSFSLLVKNKKIVYSGDIEKVEELDSLIDDDIHLLITEMSHIQPQELFKFLSKKKISRIICTHLHPDLDSGDKEYLTLSRKYLGKKVSIGYDGMGVEL